MSFLCWLEDVVEAEARHILAPYPNLLHPGNINIFSRSLLLSFEDGLDASKLRV